MAKHYFVTNRQIIIENGKEFVREDGQEPAGSALRVGSIDLSGKEASYHLVADTPPGKDVSYAPAILRDRQTKKVGSQWLFGELFDNMSDQAGKDVLVYVHGFRTNFQESLNCVKDLHERYVAPEGSTIGSIVLFSWPAQSSLLEYWNDRNDAEISGRVFARSLQKLVKFFREFFGSGKPGIEPCRRNIHLMCHSMGNYVLESATSTLLSEHTLRSLFKEVILVAADVDNDSLEPDKPLNRIVDMGQRATVYFNRHDKALVASTGTKHFVNRLGFTGPRNENQTPMNSHFIDVSDCFGAAEILQDLVMHGYHFREGAVASDIRAVLKGASTGERSNLKFLNYKNIHRLEG